MLLVPLLVGIAVVVVAVSSRMDPLKAETEWCASIDLPGKTPPTVRMGEKRPVRSPLSEAFPQLTLWIPAHDAIYQRTHAADGSAGPDIVLHAFSDAA